MFLAICWNVLEKCTDCKGTGSKVKRNSHDVGNSVLIVQPILSGGFKIYVHPYLGKFWNLTSVFQMR